MSNAITYRVRSAVPGDIPYIYSTWLRSYRTGTGLGLASGKHEYFVTYNRIIDQILDKNDCETYVACMSDDPSVILAYLTFQPGTLHYVYTKDGFRRLGIARALYNHAFKTKPQLTHVTDIGRQIMQTHTGLKYNPDLLFSLTKGEIEHEL